MKHQFSISSWRLIPLLAVGLLAGCATDNAGPNGARGHVSLLVSAQRPTTTFTVAAVLQAGDSTVIALGQDTVTIRTVEFVLRKIELKQVEAAQCDGENEGDAAAASDDSTDEEGQEGEEGEDDDDGCEEIQAGPVLVALPLGAAPTDAVVDISAPAGQYDRLTFKIHAPKLPRDSAFLTANPGFEGVSVRVTGSFSQAGTRTDFTFVSDLEASQEVTIDPPITVPDGGTASVTLRFDVSGWFLNPAGDALLDPGTANAGGPNAGVVQENIRRSINAFEDDDHDGHDDEGQDDNGGGNDGQDDG
jgi:hypothetical protein